MRLWSQVDYPAVRCPSQQVPQSVPASLRPHDSGRGLPQLPPTQRGLAARHIRFCPSGSIALATILRYTYYVDANPFAINEGSAVRSGALSLNRQTLHRSHIARYARAAWSSTGGVSCVSSTHSMKSRSKGHAEFLRVVHCWAV